MRFHARVLGRAQTGVLHRIGPWLSQNDHYLGGGTAIALHFGHRRSVDLDFFTQRKIGNIPTFARKLQMETGVKMKIGLMEQGTLHAAVSSVRVSILQYDYPLLRPAMMFPAFQCRLFPPFDLAAMKLAAVVQRGAKKDFIDIFALGTSQFSLPQMLQAYQEKYDIQDIAHVLRSLTFFDDANKDVSPQMIWPSDWRVIKRTIQDWVRKAAN